MRNTTGDMPLHLPLGHMPPSLLMMAEAGVLVGQIRGLNRSIAGLEGSIEEEGPKLAWHENPKSIKGIGPVTAAVLLRVIGDIKGFSDPGKVAAYLGLVPRAQNSNDTERSGRINKRGNKPAHTCLVQCALIAKHCGSFRQNFYQCIRHGRDCGKADIALARKLLGVPYHTLKNNWVFEEFPNFVLGLLKTG